MPNLAIQNLAVTPKTFPDGVYIGIYKGIRYYTKLAKIQCLFGWKPMSFESIRSFKLAVTRREKEPVL